MYNYKLAFASFLAVAIFAGQAMAYTVHFSDNNLYWGDNTTWDASHKWNTDNPYGSWNGNLIDVIGDPQITGGTATISSSGKLQSVTFNFYTPFNNWIMLAPGNLFINVLNSSTDTTWDYVVNTMGDPKAITPSGTPNPTFPQPKVFNITDLGIDARHGFNDNSYIMSGNDGQGIWAGYIIRDNHPIGIKDSLLTGKTGSAATFSGFPNVIPYTNPMQGSSTYIFSGDGLDLSRKDFIIAWETTCANDVVYEKINNPVPEPSTFVLLGAGLLGAVLIRRRALK